MEGEVHEIRCRCCNLVHYRILTASRINACEMDDQRVAEKPCSKTWCDIEVEEVVILVALRVSHANIQHMSIVSINLSPFAKHILAFLLSFFTIFDRVLSLVFPAK